MNVEKTHIPDLFLLIPQRFNDERGFFSESWSAAKMAKAGLAFDFLQDNHSFSVQKNTVRGLHYQSPPHAQAKLVRCGRGSLFDVAVDIRKGSPTFGRWFGVELSFENGKQLLIPRGFLHGFVTRETNTEVIYKCGNYYAPDCDGSIRFDDSVIGIDWGIIADHALLSDKDAAAPGFLDFDSPFNYEAGP